MPSKLNLSVIKSLKCSAQSAELLQLTIENKDYLFLYSEYMADNKLRWFVSSRIKALRKDTGSVLITTLNGRYRIMTEKPNIRKISVQAFLRLKHL